MRLVDPSNEGSNTLSATSWKLIRSRAWFMTWNNYTEEDFSNTVNTLETLGCEYVLGREVGENGTPHIQGCFRFKEAREAGYVCEFLFPLAYIRKCKTWKGSKIYCGKDKNYATNIVIPEKTGKVKEIPEHIKQYNAYMEETFKDVVWKPWQQEVIDIINGPPCRRYVYWFWERTGNVGKSFLCQYLDWKHNAIIANGKQADVFNQYKSFLEDEKVQPTLALIDIPRSHKDYVCYSTFEKIKDGLFYSGKYEGGKIRTVPHHLIIFSNFEPDYNKVSLDRWVMTQIE